MDRTQIVDGERSIAEIQRNQWRFDLDGLTDTERRDLVYNLNEWDATKTWRVNKHALWVDEDSPLIPCLRERFKR